MKNLQELILHPFLFALYPAVFLLVFNLHYLEWFSALRALILLLITSSLVFLFILFITKDYSRSALVTSVIFFFFFFYGHVRSILLKIDQSGFSITDHKILMPIWFGLMIFTIWWILKKLRQPSDLNVFLNIASFSLLTFVIVQGIFFQVVNTDNLSSLGIKSFADQLHPPPTEQRPDIYYIILDGYPSSRILRENYGINNQDFLEELTKRGFYIAECSRSNYPNTAYSIASSLNIDYIPPIGEQFLSGGHTWRAFGPFVHKNSVSATLKDIGYITVTFDTYYRWLNVIESDVHISSRENKDIQISNIKNVLTGQLNEYENLLLDTTPLVRRGMVLAWINKINGVVPPDNIDDTEWDNKATNNLGEQGILYEIYKNNFTQLPLIPNLPGNKFVYAHLLSTHQPFLFSKDGSFSTDQSIEGYRNSIEFTNDSILASIDRIIKESDPKPIIILQGDHSLTGTDDAFGILNAYYLPGVAKKMLYPEISPVNTFRVIFDSYFGGEFPLLEDRSYWIHDFQEKLIPEQIMVDSNYCDK